MLLQSRENNLTLWTLRVKPSASCVIERFSFKCRKTTTKVITLTNHNSRKQSKQMHVARAKRGKTRARKSRLVLVLLLISRGSGVRFFNQSQSVAMQNQSNCGITFDTQLKGALWL